MEMGQMATALILCVINMFETGSAIGLRHID